MVKRIKRKGEKARPSGSENPSFIPPGRIYEGCDHKQGMRFFKLLTEPPYKVLHAPSAGWKIPGDDENPHRQDCPTVAIQRATWLSDSNP